MSHNDGRFSIPVPDTGWTMACGSCGERWGGPRYGEREVLLTTCALCEKQRRDRLAKECMVMERKKRVLEVRDDGQLS